MAMDILRVESNERVDLADFEFVSESIIDHEQQMVDNFLCDPARTRKWILSGFAMDNPAAKQVRVTKGKAILGQRVDGVVQYGVLATEGDATLTVDLNSYAPGDYGIYVRFERIAGESQSRVFWNPSGSGSEYAQTINTRNTAAWALRIESTSPGDDWLRIGTVAQATMAITDERELFFEGKVDDSYESAWSSDGGGDANDRNSDRATYGVTDLQMFTAAMRQCLTDIRGRGLREWYEQGIGGMNIGFDTNPTEDRLAVGDADFYLDLNTADPMVVFDSADYFQYNRSSDIMQLAIAGVVGYEWDGSAFYTQGSYDLGKSGNMWPNVYGTIFHAGTANDEGCGTSWNPTDHNSFDLGTNARQWQDLYLAGLANINQLALTEIISNFKPDADNSRQLGDSAAGLGTGSDLRFTNVFLSNGWQVEKAGIIDLPMYMGTGAVDEKWWRFRVASDAFYLQVLDDSYANPVTILNVTRNGAGVDSTLVNGQFIAVLDSGYPTTPYDPAVTVKGVNPYLLFDDSDTGIDAAHRDWGILARQGTGDVGILEFLNLNTAGTSEYAWLQVETEGGAVTEVDYVTISAVEAITLGNGATNGVVNVNNDGTVAPSSNSMLGLTRRRQLGQSTGGTPFSIWPTTGSASLDSTGFIVVWVNGVERYIPFFDGHS